jgi:toxin CptA
MNEFMPIIALSKSRQLIWLLLCVHGLTLLVIWLLPWPLGWRGLLSLLIAASLVFYLLRDAKKVMRHSIVGLKYLQDNQLELQLKSGEWFTASLQPGSFVAPYLTTLAYRSQNAYFNRYLLIMPDMLDAETFRELRTHLRWKSP